MPGGDNNHKCQCSYCVTLLYGFLHATGATACGKTDLYHLLHLLVTTKGPNLELQKKPSTHTASPSEEPNMRRESPINN